MEVLKSIPIGLSSDQVLRRLHLRQQRKYVEVIVQQLLEIARPLVKPKAIYKVCYVEDKNEDWLNIGGIRFTSRVLRVNLDKVESVFPYVATCGRELDEIVVPANDLMRSYCLDIVKEVVLRSALDYFEDYLKRTYALPQLSTMNPGSLKSWPITQQKQLFSIFGDVEGLIGVKLTDSYAMVPPKSVSGIYFPTKIQFESCQLCPREVCSERRAPYAPDLAENTDKRQTQILGIGHDKGQHKTKFSKRHSLNETCRLLRYTCSSLALCFTAFV